MSKKRPDAATLIEKAAGHLIAVADDSGRCLVDVIAEMERYIVRRIGVVPADRRGYTIRDGRLVPYPVRCVECGREESVQIIAYRATDGALLCWRCAVRESK
jgi:hypothetical protein